MREGSAPRAVHIWDASTRSHQRQWHPPTPCADVASCRLMHMPSVLSCGVVTQRSSCPDS
eukprot:12891574-Prorocentrum_lima.AAC.1